MTGFSADWLDLREAADRVARDAGLIADCAALLRGRTGAVCDLGSGTGAAVRAFGPAFPEGLRWWLVDRDAANLALATDRLAGVATVETLIHDLTADVAPWPAGCALVTATALFDLAAPAWIARLADALARDRLPILATLSYNGAIALDPPHPSDDAMIAAFNLHQTTDKGLGGPAAGPRGAAILAEALLALGYRVDTAPSPWRLTARDRPLIAATLDGWAAAVVDAGLVPAEAVAAWRDARLLRTDGMVIGHTDVLARPA